MNMPPRTLRILVATGVAAVLAVGGLKLWWDHAVDQVSVVLTDARIGVKLGLLGMPSSAVIDTVFDVENGNFVGAELTSIDYVVRINGREVGPGHGPPPGSNHTIAASGRSSIATSTELGFLAMAQAGIDGVEQRRAEVEVEGDVHARILGLPMARHFKVHGPGRMAANGAANLDGQSPPPQVEAPR